MELFEPTIGRINHVALAELLSASLVFLIAYVGWQLTLNMMVIIFLVSILTLIIRVIFNIASILPVRELVIAPEFVLIVVNQFLLVAWEILHFVLILRALWIKLPFSTVQFILILFVFAILILFCAIPKTYFKFLQRFHFFIRIICFGLFLFFSLLFFLGFLLLSSCWSVLARGCHFLSLLGLQFVQIIYWKLLVRDEFFHFCLIG